MDEGKSPPAVRVALLTGTPVQGGTEEFTPPPIHSTSGEPPLDLSDDEANLASDSEAIPAPNQWGSNSAKLERELEEGEIFPATRENSLHPDYQASLPARPMPGPDPVEQFDEDEFWFCEGCQKFWVAYGHPYAQVRRVLKLMRGEGIS